MSHEAILLPGAVLPADLAYGGLLEALGDGVAVRAKDLELYRGDEPRAGYGLETEIDGILRAADAADFERFNLVGYSGGGAASLALVSRHPERVLSLALLEPPWIGNEGLSEPEREARAELERLRELPPPELMSAFVRFQLAPGVEPPPPPPSPPPPWMAKRPAGIRALTAAFERFDLPLDSLRRFERPVYYALGALSNPRSYGAMADRLAAIFPDYALEVYAGRHHFDPPHRIEPERLAARLRELWDRAAAARR